MDDFFGVKNDKDINQIMSNPQYKHILQTQDLYLKYHRKCKFIASQLDSLFSDSQTELLSNATNIFDDEMIGEIVKIKPIVADFDKLRLKKCDLLQKF